MQRIDHKAAILGSWRDIMDSDEVYGLEDAIPWVAIPPEVAMGILADVEDWWWTSERYMRAMG